ncbi:CHAD domain-containing protein [Glaciimonas sp. GG7]
MSDVSKAERGYRLALPTTTEKTIEIVHASTPALSERQTIGQGFQGIVANCVAQIQGNEAGVVLGTDVESVHQMRVGVRRLRSALAMFGDHLPLPDTLMVDCEWLAQHLGAVRDWDVFAGTTLDAVASVCKEMPAFQTLRQQALDVAQENRVTMVEAINSPRYARLLLTLGACVHGADVGLSEDASLGDFASVQLAHYQKKMVQHGKGVAHSNAAERHRLRIAAKKLRYTLAFFASLYSAKKFNAYVAGLSGLQDALGEINDASVADRLLRTCAEGHAELVEVCAYIRGYSVARNEKNLKKLVKLWKTFGQLNADF